MKQALEAHLSSRQVARVIYGAIIGMALIVSLQDHPPSAGVMVATLLATGLTVALAELYSEWLGIETSRRRHMETGELRRSVAGSSAVAFGISFPVVFFLFAATGALESIRLSHSRSGRGSASSPSTGSARAGSRAPA